MSQLLPERRSRGVERWEPLRDLEQVTERMRQMLDESFGGFASPLLATERFGWTPPVDIEETDDAYVIEAELPSVKREDVNIEIVGTDLEITGEVRERERKGVLRRQTRRTGRFAYRVSLPSEVDENAIEANLAEGVLTVRVPKSEQRQRRRIEIRS